MQQGNGQGTQEILDVVNDKDDRQTQKVSINTSQNNRSEKRNTYRK